MGKSKTVSALRKRAKKTTFDIEGNDEVIIEEREEREDDGADEHQATETENEVEAQEAQDEGQTKRKRVRKRKKAEESIPAADSAATETDASKYCNDNTVYIEGLPFSAQESDVLAFFRPAGTITSCRLPKWHDSGRLRGYGHIEFSTSEEAQKALDMDGSYLQNRYIKIERPLKPKLLTDRDPSTIIRPAGCRTIFVKNLPYDCTENDVTEAFRFCGKIANVRLAIWAHTEQLKGFGYVEFKNEDSAEIAVKKSNTIRVKGRPVFCDFETGKPKGSFKTQDDIAQSKSKKLASSKDD